jgi:asparagine synthase (glutamine-hydrolysing)
MAFDRYEMSHLGMEREAIEAMENEHEKIWNDFSRPGNNLSLNLLACFTHTRLVNDYLVKVDRASMLASLEMRSPFLDKDMARFAATLKRSDLYHKHGPKSVLKSLAEKFFPKEFVHRNKMGFGVPVGQWLRTEWKTKFQEVVLGGKQSLIHINYDFIGQLFKRHLTGEDHTEKLWALYVFHVWAQNLKR